MSDDEYYANSPYDDYDDLLWDEIPEDIAGDLAEHTLHSPVWADDPGYELQQGFSDWDYYSDDYYDDDPSLLKNDPQDGSPLAGGKKKAGQVKRGKKRKLVEIEDIPPLDLGERGMLEQCIQGTVWAEGRPRSRVNPIYREGESDRVALLREWRQIFKDTDANGEHSKKAFGRGQLHHDESWANDMSLEDMGLATAKGKLAAGEPEINAEAPDEEDDGDDDEEEEEEEEEGEEGDLEISEVEKDSAEVAAVEMLHANAKDIPDDGEQSYGPRKRQKRTESMLPPVSNRPLREQQHSNSKDSSEIALRQTNGTTERGIGRDKRATAEPESKAITLKKKKMATIEPLRSKKRPASPSEDEPAEHVAGSTVSSRAKRVASSKLSAKEEKALSEDMPAPLLPSAKRVTRSRKKG